MPVEPATPHLNLLITKCKYTFFFIKIIGMVFFYVSVSGYNVFVIHSNFALGTHNSILTLSH